MTREHYIERIAELDRYISDLEIERNIVVEDLLEKYPCKYEEGDVFNKINPGTSHDSIYYFSIIGFDVDSKGEIIYDVCITYKDDKYSEDGRNSYDDQYSEKKIDELLRNNEFELER